MSAFVKVKLGKGQRRNRRRKNGSTSTRLARKLNRVLGEVLKPHPLQPSPGLSFYGLSGARYVGTIKAPLGR